MVSFEAFRRSVIVDLALHELQGVRHVRLGIEEDRDLAGAADGLRRDSARPEHRARRFLERPRDGELHEARREIAGPGHDDDARELDLGVDVARQRHGGPDAGSREQDDTEQDRAAVAGSEAGDVHLGCARRARSPSP
jgi:hypothetical protein